MSRTQRSCLVLFAVLAALVLPLPSAVAQAPQEDHRYALLVGVHKYDPFELKELPYAERDVEELAQVLLDAGYRKENVVVLTGTRGATDRNLLPTGANIRKQLQRLLQGRTAEDSMVVAFAGHGVQYKKSEDCYFCPADARLADRKTLLSLQEVYRTLKDSDAGFKLLLADACRDKPLPPGARDLEEVESATRPEKVPPPGGVAALFSCSAGQKAYEAKDRQHGVFFYFVIQGLRGEAGDGKHPDITLSNLAAYVEREVPAFVGEHYQVKQVPEQVGETRGAIPLVTLRTLPADTLARLRSSVDADGRITDARLRQQTGWEALRGFAWWLEVEDPDKPGHFTAVDAGHTFRHGQRFRLRVEALCDLHVYVLSRNADGSEVVLLPEKAEEVALVRRGRTLVLPEKGQPFSFEAPAGTEHLRLIASPTELPWLAGKELFRLHNGQVLTAREQTVVDQLTDARARGLDAGGIRATKLRGVTIEPQARVRNVRDLDEAIRDIAAGRLPRGVTVVATTPVAGGNLVIHASADPRAKAILVHEVALEHEE